MNTRRRAVQESRLPRRLFAVCRLSAFYRLPSAFYRLPGRSLKNFDS
jgi:hypothetical protein